MKSGKRAEVVDVRVRQAARLLALGALRASAKQEEQRKRQRRDCRCERQALHGSRVASIR